MKDLRVFVCKYILKDYKLYKEFQKWLKRQELEIEFILFDEEDIEMDRESLEIIEEATIRCKKIVEKLNESGFKSREKSESIVLNVSDMEFKEIYKLKEKIKKEIISGVKGISQVLIVKKDKDYVIITLGTNIKKIMDLKEVDKNKLISNDFHEVAGIFGIEAARQLIIEEIKSVLNSQGLDIDMRHLELAADAMSNTGLIKGVTRMGIIAQKSSILARATFETPDKQFVNASIKGSKDRLTSVIENIILNQPVPVGTGLPGLLVKVIGPMKKKEKDMKKASEKIIEEVNK